MRTLIVGAAALSAATALLPLETAQAADGFYLSGHGGLAMPSDLDLSSPSSPGIGAEAENDEGYVFGGAVGYKFQGFRVELEGTYRHAGVDDATLGGISIPVSGDLSIATGMANAYYDLDLTPLGVGSMLGLLPYVGGGVGFARVGLDTDDSSLFSIDDSDTAFAWNLQAGLGYQVTEAGAVTAGSRYLHVDETEVSASAAGFGSGDLEVDSIDSHELLLGLRYSF